MPSARRPRRSDRRRLPPAPAGAAHGLEWHRHRDSFIGTVDGQTRFLLDPTAHGDWILWSVDPRTGVQTRKIDRYPTAADAKDAARHLVQHHGSHEAPHRVADFSTLPEIIEHARMVDGSSHVLVAGTRTKLYFPLGGGRYEESKVWREHGYWHSEAPGDRTVVDHLPAGTQPIETYQGRTGGQSIAVFREASRGSPRGGSTRRISSRAPEMTPDSVMRIAGDLSRKVGGSAPKHVGAHRWSDKNESAVFTTHSPQHGQRVVVLVSVFEDGTIALDFFSSEERSELDRYENIVHFLYSRVDLGEMVADIKWVWETVDGYAESWQQPESD